MNTRLLLISVLIVIVACKSKETVVKKEYKWPANIKPPVAEKKAQELTAHGDTRVDNYFWMADYFKQGPDSTKAVDYLKAENAYLDTMMAGTKDFQNTLLQK